MTTQWRYHSDMKSERDAAIAELPNLRGDSDDDDADRVLLVRRATKGELT